MIKYDTSTDKLIVNIFGLKLSINFGRMIFDINSSIIRIFDKLLPKHSDSIVFYIFPGLEKNVLTYYNYLKKSYPGKYKLYLYTTDKAKLGTDIYYLKSFRSLYHMYTSKYVVVSHASIFIDYFSSKRHVYVNLWHGMPIKKLGYCENNLDKYLLKRYRFLGDNSHLFVTSDIFKQLFVSCFLMKYDNIHVTGSSRNDVIWDNSNSDNIENVYHLKQYKHVVFYLPTFKCAGGKREKQLDKNFNNIFYMDDYDKNIFKEVIEQEDILFLIKPHPHEENFYKEHPEIIPDGDRFKVIYNEDLEQNGIDLYEMFSHIDLMLCDYSSVAIDYLILNKPVIYLNNLAKEYSKGRGMILSDNFEILMPGVKVNNFKVFMTELINNLKTDEYKQTREKMLPLIHKYRDDKASERIYEIMKGL